eukprot:14860-Eustigmatos_ZCMA.PRE.1
MDHAWHMNPTCDDVMSAGGLSSAQHHAHAQRVLGHPVVKRSHRQTVRKQMRANTHALAVDPA